jgi:hypothetical protein
VRFTVNRFAERSPYTPEEAQILSVKSAARARGEISRCPEFETAPLHSLSGLATRIMFRDLLYKDESGRLVAHWRFRRPCRRYRRA